MKMKTSESITEIAKALSIFQSEVKQPEKNGENPHFKSKYVTLDGTVKSIHECAPKHGLSYTQMPVSDENGVGVVTVIFHTSGQFIEFDPFILPLDKKTAQGVGSALTYSKRYALSAAFGIVSDIDDDGNEATDNAPIQKPSKPQLATPKQLDLITKLINDVSTTMNITTDVAYKSLKKHLKKDMEWYTPSDASKAIELLNTQLKQGA
jgi:hypothetical protein